MEFKMILKRVLLCAFVLLLPASVAVGQDAVKDQVSCYTTWDDTYFYLGFRIDGPDVRATHSKPNMDLTGDDAVEFYVETDNKHSMKISPACFSMAVSVAGDRGSAPAVKRAPSIPRRLLHSSMARPCRGPSTTLTISTWATTSRWLSRGSF